MKNKNIAYVILMTIFCVLLNMGGKYIAQILNLPIWMDTLGTILMAYVGGPVNGAIVGFASNIVYGVFIDYQSLYSFVGLLIGVIIGKCAHKKYIDSAYMSMNLGVILAVVCTVSSTVITEIFYGGLTGNVWGDQMVYMLESMDFPRLVSMLIGQFYVEFLDKVIAVMTMYLGIKFHRYIREKYEVSHNHSKQDTSSTITSAVIAFCIISGAAVLGLSHSTTVLADENLNNSFDTYTQVTYSREEGLTAGEANCVAQTKDGLIWIGTYAGLYSYDGQEFTLHSEYDSIKNVNCLYVDEEGRLWVGTNDLGLSIIIDGDVANTLDTSTGMPSNSIRCINCDSEGLYHVGTSAGMAIVTINGGMTILDVIDSISYSKNICVDNDNHTIVVTDDGGLYLLESQKIVDFLNISSKGKLFSCCYVNGSTLYVGMDDNSVRIFDISKGSLNEKEEIKCDGLEYINAIYQLESGEIFLCADTGIGYLDVNDVFHMINTNSFNNSFENMLEDYQGNLWFSSSRLGLLEMCNSSFVDVFAEVGLESDVVNAITKWNGNIYYGCDKGLDIINKATNSVITNTLTEYLNGVRIRCLYVDSNNNLWIATTGSGLICVPSGYQSVDDFIVYNEENCDAGNRFRCVIEAQDGSIIVGGDDGLISIKDQQIQYSLKAKDGLENTKILCLYEMADGTILAASDGDGIYKIQNGKITGNLSTADGLRSNVILKIRSSETQDGFYVITSNSMSFVTNNFEVNNLTKFPYSNNYDIISDGKGSVWITCSAGIYITDEATLLDNQSSDAELINTRSGLRIGMIANSWSYLDDNNDLYLCGDTGACYVNMNQVGNLENAYRMVLNYITVDGVKYEINRSDITEIPNDISRIDFEPYILNYSLNDPYISYYLEGYDDHKTIVPLSQLETITYTNLPSGQYVFHMSVINTRSNTDIEAGSYTFEKKSEMYQNWWFKLYAILVGGLFVVWFTWFITRSRSQKVIERQELEIEYAKKQLKMGNETILSIARTVDAKDSNTSQHSFRVSEYSVKIARRLGWSDEKCENLRQIGLLHDIGKIGIPDSILNKPAKLTDEEYEIMKTHVTRGGEILKDFTMIENVAIGAMYHHERYDGTGYAHGLKGEEIPIEARIIGLADAFDAMTANRVYRKHLDWDYVLSELKRCSGTQFDPKLVEVFLELIDDGEINIEELYNDSKEEES